MDYEKTYKDALEWMRSIYPTLTGAAKEDAEHYFPGLKESEDERIRGAILIYLDWLDGRKDCQPKGDYSIRDMIAYLEKQKEQQSTNSEIPKEWTEEDSFAIKEIQVALSQHCTSEKHRRNLCRWLDLHCNAYPLPEKLYPHWKPSEEQMESLYNAVVRCRACSNTVHLPELYEDLKTL